LYQEEKDTKNGTIEVRDQHLVFMSQMATKVLEKKKMRSRFNTIGDTEYNSTIFTPTTTRNKDQSVCQSIVTKNVA